MTRNTNNNSDQANAQLYDKLHEELLYDELYEELLYELLLYKKKDIIAIQEKLGMAVSERPSINDNTNQTALNQSKKGKTLEDSFGLLFDLVEELKPILEVIDICGHPILTISKYARSYGCNIWGNATWDIISFAFIFGRGYKRDSRSSWYCWLYYSRNKIRSR